MLAKEIRPVSVVGPYIFFAFTVNLQIDFEETIIQTFASSFFLL